MWTWPLSRNRITVPLSLPSGRWSLPVSQVFSVAKELVRLSLSGDEKDPLTNLRLHKLLYYAQAWSLVLRESELFSDDLQAWRCGPVVPAVYHKVPDGQSGTVISANVFAD